MTPLRVLHKRGSSGRALCGRRVPASAFGRLGGWAVFDLLCPTCFPGGKP